MCSLQMIYLHQYQIQPKSRTLMSHCHQVYLTVTLQLSANVLPAASVSVLVIVASPRPVAVTLPF